MQWRLYLFLSHLSVCHKKLFSNYVVCRSNILSMRSLFPFFTKITVLILKAPVSKSEMVSSRTAVQGYFGLVFLLN